MKAYISISYSKAGELRNELNTIKEVLNDSKIIPFVFIESYQFRSDQEKEMMQQAVKDIEACDFLIAETSDKGIGIGIEVGYAKAKNKPVIYVRKESAEHSTTVSGISDHQIIYKSTGELKEQFKKLLLENWIIRR